jgi:flagellar L-ring protein FlgH
MNLGYRTLILLLSLSASVELSAQGTATQGKAKKPPVPSALDRYIKESLGHTKPGEQIGSDGSLWTPTSRFMNLGGDLRATQVDDLINIQVVESASAVVNGATKTQRQSSASASVNALGGIKSPKSALVNLANTNSATKLDGQGVTSRSTAISTNLSARISYVLPNGYLVVEGTKEVGVNSERQTVTVRGVIRPSDLSTDNSIRSDQIAQLELQVNGKGVVGDAVRRPFILYRLLLGLLPF